tara:strand:+ start:27 stop:524 length:498 start_codon:yes stop_codon:yes gene_type:complete
MKNQIIWVIWLIIYILIFVAYDREPLKYSNKTILDIITYSTLYKILTYIALIIHTFYGIYLTTNFPFVSFMRKYWNYSTFLIGIIVINSLSKKPIEDPEKFYLPPNNLNKKLGFIYLLLIIIPICLKLFLTNSNLCLGLALIYLIKKIINKNYASCLYDLPKTFT